MIVLLLPISNNTYSFAEQTVQVTIALGAGSSADSACVPTNSCFTPNPVQIASGDTVIWTNTDTVSHTVTSGKPSDNQTGTVFDSGVLIKPGSTFQFTFQNPGTYNYFCLVHPWMTGLVVTSAPPPTIIIPPLLKIIAGEWASGQISDSDFLQSIQYFINQGLLIMPIPQANSETTAPIPMWIKTNAGWWANGIIGDSDFIKGIQYLFENGYLPVSVNGIPNPVSQALSESVTQLISDISKMNLPQGTANSLTAKLNSALSSLSSHQNNVAKAHLNSFISEVDAQSGKKITTDQANELVSAAQNIINSIT